MKLLLALALVCAASAGKKGGAVVSKAGGGSGSTTPYLQRTYGADKYGNAYDNGLRPATAISWLTTDRTRKCGNTRCHELPTKNQCTVPPAQAYPQKHCHTNTHESADQNGCSHVRCKVELHQCSKYQKVAALWAPKPGTTDVDARKVNGAPWVISHGFNPKTECDGTTNHYSVRVTHHAGETECLAHQGGHHCGLGVYTGDKTKCECRAVRLNGHWGGWGRWSTCSKSCGQGVRSRTRYCNNPAPRDGGLKCEGDDYGDGVDKDYDRNCNPHPCPINGGWSGWGRWPTCSQSCTPAGGMSGFQTRTRSCTNPSPDFGGIDCTGIDGSGLEASHRRRCNEHACPINGNWGAWQTWGGCSKTCSGGRRTRTRQCNNPAPKHGGAACSTAIDDHIDVEPCQTQCCPGSGGRCTCQMESVVPLAGQCSNCGVTGGCCVEPGRFFKCFGPGDRINGHCHSAGTVSCDANTCSHRFGSCSAGQNQQPSVNGKWTSWSTFGSCSVTCGQGRRTRTRSCTNPSPSNGGNNCVGATQETEPCDAGPCCVSNQGARCSCQQESVTHRGPCHTCDASNCCIEQNRFFTCSGSTNGFCHTHGTIQCNGQCATVHGRCAGGQNRFPSVNGRWGSWQFSGGCNASCGTGTRPRTRSCNNPSPSGGGASCQGSSSDRVTCSGPPCCASNAGQGCTCGMERYYSPTCGIRNCVEPGRFFRCSGPVGTPGSGQCFSSGTRNCQGQCAHRYGTC